MKRYLFKLAAVGAALAALVFASPAAQDKSSYNIKAANAIKAVLEAQAAAWNRGDLEGYMDGYDRSPNTEFVGGDTIDRGWQRLLDVEQRIDHPVAWGFEHDIEIAAPSWPFAQWSLAAQDVEYLGKCQMPVEKLIPIGDCADIVPHQFRRGHQRAPPSADSGFSPGW